MELSGVLILNKPCGMTSHDCVNRIRRLYSTKKVGHTGTLDPDASGVLPILIGRAAKAADLLLADDKLYRAGLKLGITTDTEDTSGRILTKSDELPTEARLREVCAEFVGDIMQIPPMYSALKRGGVKLVDLARRGVTVEREPRPIKIYSLKVESTESADSYMLNVHCSKGTYIRTLCADIGAVCGCGGVMSSLVRQKSGSFSIDDSITLDELEGLEPIARNELLRPVESLFGELPELHPSPFFEKLSRSGCEIYQHKLGTDFELGTRVRMYGSDGFFALGEVGEYPEGSAVKVVKLFLL